MNQLFESRKIKRWPFLIVLFCMFLFTESAFAATRTWDGGGATNNWSETANWSGDLVPASGDDVVFDGTSTKDCLVNQNITVNTLNMNAGYSGTVTIGAGFTASFTNASTFSSAFTASDGSLNFGSTFTLAGAAFNAGSGTLTFVVYTQNDGTFICGSTTLNVVHFTVNSGAFTAPTGILSVSGNFIINGGTFDHNNGTVNAVGGLNVAYTFPTGTILNNFTIDKTGDSGPSLSATLRVIGTLKSVSDFSDWAIGNLIPTAATVEITGRVLMFNGRPIPNAVLVLSGGSLSEPKYGRTSPFGYYRFTGVPVGSYVIVISAKGRNFSRPSVFVAVDESIENLNFVAQP